MNKKQYAFSKNS